MTKKTLSGSEWAVAGGRFQKTLYFLRGIPQRGNIPRSGLLAGLKFQYQLIDLAATGDGSIGRRRFPLAQPGQTFQVSGLPFFLRNRRETESILGVTQI